MNYELIRSDRRSFAAQIKDGRLIVRVPKRATDGEIDRFIAKNKRWIETHLEKAREREKEREATPKLTDAEIRDLADKALAYIPDRVKYYAPLIGVTYGRITIRNQKTRWGSCSTKGNLNFNCMLMLAPPEVIDSVVVHELCHRKQMNHSAKFYAEETRVFPNYSACDKWLKENGNRILSMMER